MGITLSMTGAFRETGASFFFVPKGALTHHLRSRRWYPSLRSGRALCEADRALCGERQTMPPSLLASVVIACAAGRRLSPHLHLRCKSLSLPWDNLPPTCDKPATAQGTPFGCGSFVAEMDDAIPHRPFSFACAKRNKNASLRGAERT